MQPGPSHHHLTFQDTVRQRLVERNERENAYAGIIEQYRRLAQQTRLLKERNQSLLRAVGTVRSNPSASTVLVGAEDNPVRAAYTASLESQISSLRDELAAVYKTQGQNAQRLLAMNETLREKEEQSRLDAESHRKAQDELATLRRKVEQHNELMAEKDRTAQILHDEIATLTLELNQLELRNADLRKDNASLLSRWIDKMNLEAEKVNEANLLYQDMKSKHETTSTTVQKPLKSSDASLQSGNGVANGTSRSTKSPLTGSQSTNQTPNLNPNG